MRLKGIMLHGFKSFQHRTDVPLGDGITAIVGPNGCGKSNVSDAIRWVLGEANVRNIRGENILDVIFKGSGGAKPAGFAEVSLTLDNEDHSLPLDAVEVSVARRVFRDGDSEFLINQNPCRLKDIRNLFLGTGLGSQGYSIIQREMVDAVLSDHDDQRRLFFEEAAGISRYKVQRKETLRKLESVEQDLVRIDDIVREIEREVRSLARQVGKARKHDRVLGQIRDLEVGLALSRWDALSNQQSSRATDRVRWDDHRARMSADLAKREADLESRRLALIGRESALDEARRQREALLQEQAANREQSSILTTRIQGWEQRDADLVRRIAEESAREVSLRARVSERAPDVERLTQEKDGQDLVVAEAEAVFEAAEKQLRASKEEAARAAQIHMEQVVVRTQDSKELESLATQEGQHSLRRGSLKDHRDRLAAKAEELTRNVASRDGELAGLVDAQNALDEEGRRLDAEQTQGQESREELRQQREDLARRRASLESRLNLLREQKACHDGFDAAIRFLLERRQAVPGLVGVVGELVSAPPTVAAPVAEALLADAVQWIVVEDEAAALRAIDLLRGEGQGGVTFFPLRENAERWDREADAWAEGLPLAAPDNLAPLIRCLCARVRPTESRAEAGERAHSRGSAPHLRFLTPEGDVFAEEGWIRMTGGQGAVGEIIERMREIPRLGDALDRLAKDESATLIALSACEREIAARGLRLEEIGSESSSLLARRHRAEKEISERRIERDLLLEEAERTSGELIEIEKRIDGLIEERRAIERRLGISGESGRDAEERYRDAKAAEEESALRRDRAFEGLSSARADRVQTENELREIESLLARDGEEADRLAEAVRVWESERTEAARLREDAILECTFLRDRSSELEEELIEAENALESRRKERDEENTLVAALEHENKDLRGELEGLKERLHSEEVRGVEIRSEKDRLRERILQEFQVDIAEEAKRRAAEGSAAPTPPAAEEPEFLDEPIEGEEPEPDFVQPVEDADAGPKSERERIEDLRRQLLGIGPVNFLAAEEYATQKTRLTDYRKQQTDLRQAQKDLHETIRQINETAGRLFSETFTAARDHFTKVFEFLFPGGEADLRLLGEDPLEGEIEIVARPSGKRLQAVRLLSTGERSLTAIALLFGIYLVKPSPFCTLDEVDAPLDDANVGRFVTLLRHFSQKSQFVVITHNKKTMEAADRLYGVTMPEPGISRIVSVHLSEGGAELEGLEPAASTGRGEDESV